MDDYSASPSTSRLSCDPGFNSPAPSEVLKGVVAYVEVRTANDNRSAAVTWVLERMGAKVEEKFSDNVTHVIFKEGKKRTRDKAQKLGIHLVSVLWVDSCKEKQQRVPEHEFSANTVRCGTPPPGIRWKKYHKSMQPRDFEDEVARSAERCQKRQRRKDIYRQLLQGGGTATPFHSPAHVLVVDTQPRSPFSSLDIQTPVIIPNTPPSMQARLTQLIHEKEAKRRGEAEESPVGPDVGLDLEPLQRALFKNQTPPQEEKPDKAPVPRRTSSRLSGRVSRTETSRTSGESRKSSDDTSTGASWQPSHGTRTVTEPETEYQNNASSDPESVDSELGVKSRHRRGSDPEIILPSQNPPQGLVRQRRKATRQSMPCMSSKASQNFSQLDKWPWQKVQKGDKTDGSGASVDGPSTADPHVPKRGRSEETKISKRDSNSSTDKDVKPKGSGRGKRDSGASKQSKKKTNDSDSTKNSLSHKESETTSSNVSNSKPASRKRKLLNPGQELLILSPSPTENPNVPTAAAAEGTERQKRGKKRKSSDVDAIFPSSPPASKRGRGSSQMKENRGRKISATQGNIGSKPPLSKSSKNSKKNAVKKRSTLQKSKGDDSVSSLSSTAQTASILGSSMSMVFNDSCRVSVNRLAPPRNSIAEFKEAKAKGQGKRGLFGKGGGSSSSRQEGGRDPRRMSLHKFRLTCMPSLVMTSLHREEQDFVIGAVKRLGVFRVEDRVSKHTTHVVCGEARRTLNTLHALARGCWLVSKDWVERSLEEKHWINEEDYEMTEEIPMSKESRLAREAVEPGSYQCGLFESVGTVFVSSECTPPRAQLVKLLQLCGGRVTDCIQRADFYIGDKVHDDKNSIKPVWVLDCISQQEVLPMDDYILAINHKPKTCGSPEF